MSRFRLPRWILCIGFTVSSACFLRADIEPVGDVDQETTGLIEQLASDDIAEQHNAILQLENRKLDVVAISRLQEIADSGDVLKMHTSIRLLGRAAKEESDPGSSARESLQELVGSKNPHVSALARHFLVINGMSAKARIPKVPSGLPASSQADALGKGHSTTESVQVTNTDGVRHIEVQSRGRSIDIQDRDGESIDMTVTEIVGGKETRCSAKDIEELKRTNPDMAKMYEKYSKASNRGHRGPIGFGHAEGFGHAQPLDFPPGFEGPMPPIAGQNHISGGAANEVHEKIEKCLERISTVRKEFEKLDKESFSKDKMKKLLDELDIAKKELFAAQAQLGVN